ncbi:hypothetical protein L1887_11847 [Cichorium endivia]|nr:hypothetical protein L1887_11847 [Cichorium endivia]
MKLKLRKPKIDEIRIAYVVLIRRGVGRYLVCSNLLRKLQNSRVASIFLSSLAARFSRFLLLDHTKINNLSGGRSGGRASMADQKGGPIAGEGYAVTGN